MKTQRGDFTADRRLLLLSLIAMPIGAVCTGVALLLTTLINFFTNLFFRFEWSFAAQPPDLSWGVWTALVPVVGGLIIGLMARYGSERIRGHGIPEALEAILYGKSIMQPKVAILKPLSSAISIGSGGPFGAEGPIIMTGGAFGSILAQQFHLTAAERKTLLVAGASAGMAAIFGTPLAAVLLAIELLLFEWRPRSLVPVAVACAIAAGLRPYVLHGALPLFPLPEIPQLGALALLASAGVGLIAGAFSWGLSTSLYKLEDAFGHLKIHWCWWPALGGIAVGIGGLVEPRARGVGDDVIEMFLHGDAAPSRALAILAVKGLIWIVALASGTSGGVLAPLLMMGAGIGVVEAQYLSGPTSLWPLVSMAAVMGGMMRSPFTAIVFALELTDDIHALPVLMVACVAAYGFTVLTMPRSILTEKVSRRGLDVFREYGVDPLERVQVHEVMTREVIAINADSTADAALKMFDKGRGKHRGYPVIDGGGRVTGVITASDALAWTEAQNTPETLLTELLARTPIVGIPSETCRTAAERMAKEGIGRLPVVDEATRTRLIGILTRSDLLRARSVSSRDEEVREKTIRRKPVSSAASKESVASGQSNGKPRT
jgi:H+/Cl- antiporter ClcA/CBS domain-containing protein